MTAEVIALDSYDRQVARRVKLAIFDSGKTQKAVAAAAGIGPSAMTSRMNGTRPWRVEEIVLIAQATGVEVGALLPRLDSNQQPFGYARDYRSGAWDCGTCGAAFDTEGGWYRHLPTCRPRAVVDLAAYKARRAS